MKYKSTAHFLGEQLKNKFGGKTKKTKSNLFLIIIFLVVASFFFVAMIGFAGYWTNESSLVNSINRILPYPAAVVDGKIVKLSDWQIEYRAWKMANEKEGSQISDQQIKEEVLDKLINQVFVFELAKKYQIKATPEEIDSQLQDLVERAGSEEVLKNDIQEIFGWELQQFVDRLLYPEVLKQKLIQEMSQSPKAKKDSYKKANEVLRKIAKGEDFANLAKDNSDDQYSVENSGEWDWLEKGMVDEKIDQVAFALEVGEVSDLIDLESAYLIIKLEDKRQMSDEENEETTNVEQVKLRVILIANANFYEEIEKMTNESKVTRFVRLEENKK